MDPKMQDILKGNFDYEFEKESKIIKLFLSSTFSDSHAERDYLLEKIYPILRNYCKESYNLDFQIADLRWGIKIADKVLNNNASVCVNEVKSCVEISAKPNFVALIGQRYGTRTLIEEIPENEFQKIENYLKSVKNGDDLLRKCYKLDENSVPSVYRLLPRYEILKNYFEDDQESESSWNELECNLKLQLKKAVNNVLEIDERHKYFISVTELEIEHGIVRVDSPNDTALVFIKNIESVTSDFVKENKNLVKRYFDLNSDDQVDMESKDLLDNLKIDKIHKYLSKTNIFELKPVKLNETFGISAQTHFEYLNDLGTRFYENVKRLIDKNIKKNALFDGINDNDLKVIKEVISHFKFCKELNEKLLPRSDLLKLEEYLDADSCLPFVIYGDSGSGKTSSIASIMNKILPNLKNNENFKAILRFFGTTPGSSCISEVLCSIIRQLEIIYKLPSVKTDYNGHNSKELSEILSETIETVVKNHPNDRIFILLDSIDQLNMQDYTLDWLFVPNFPQVKVFYSTLTNHGDILNKIRIKIKDNGTNYMEIKHLDKSFGLSIIDKWLNESKRKISNKQRDILNNLLDRASLYPLYIKLVFDVISKWRSFDESPELENRFLCCTDIDKIIEYIFKELEKAHGELIIKRCMFYLTSFDTGISESELEDILSLDNDVLVDLFEKRDPPVCRFPASVWGSIKSKIAKYLTEKQVDNTQVIFWYHRRFYETAKRLYVNGKDIAKELNCDKLDELTMNVIDVFTEKWRNEPKPFADSKRNSARRLTGIQPFEIKLKNGEKQYNLRKINSLLKFSSKIYNRDIWTNMMCTKIYLDYRFMHCNFSRNFDVYRYFASCIHEKDSKPRESLTGEETKLINDYNEKSRRTVTSNTSIFIHWLYQTNMDYLYKYNDAIAYQLTSRLLVFYGISKLFTQFIDDCDRDSINHCALVAPYAFLPFDSAAVIPFKNYSAKIESIQYKTDVLYLLTHEKINVLNLKVGQQITDIQLPKLQKDNFFTFRVIESNSTIIIASKKNIFSINYKGTLNFHQNYGDLIVKDIFILNTKFFIVVFENKNFYQILDVKDKEFKPIVKSFDSSIKLVTTSLSSIHLYEVQSTSRRSVFTAFLLSSNEIMIYDVQDDDNNSVPEFVLAYATNVDSTKVVSFKFPDNSPELCVTFTDSVLLFSVVVVDDKISFTECYIKQRNLKNENETPRNLNIIQYSDGFCLLLEPGKSIYLLNTKSKEKIYEFEGTYETGSFFLKNDGTMFIAAYNGDGLDVYFTNGKKYVKIVESMTQIGSIKFLIQTVSVVLSISEQGRVFRTIVKAMLPSQSHERRYSRLKYAPTGICCLYEPYVVSYSNSNETFSIWNTKNGKIISSMKSGCNSILQLEYFSGAIFLIGASDKTSSVFEVYAEKNEFSDLSLIQKFDYLNCDTAIFRINETNSQISVVLLNRSTLQLVIECYQIDPKISVKKLSSCNIDATSKTDGHFKCLNITDLNNYIAVIQNDNIVFYNKTNGKEILQNNISNSKSVASTSIVSTVKGTDNLCILNEIGELSYCIVEESKKVLKIVTLNDCPLKRFQLSGSSLCAYDEKHDEFLVYDLQSVAKIGSFSDSSIKIKQKLATPDLELLCVSKDLKYLVIYERSKTLSMYRLSDKECTQIAYIPLHSHANQIAFTDKFVCLALKDGRVLSLLIRDPTEPSHAQRILELESRNSNRKITKDVMYYYLEIIVQNEIRKDITWLDLNTLFELKEDYAKEQDIEYIDTEKDIYDAYMKIVNDNKQSKTFNYLRDSYLLKLKKEVKDLPSYPLTNVTSDHTITETVKDEETGEEFIQKDNPNKVESKACLIS